MRRLKNVVIFIQTILDFVLKKNYNARKIIMQYSVDFRLKAF